jgi:hypothetical protein
MLHVMYGVRSPCYPAELLQPLQPSSTHADMLCSDKEMSVAEYFATTIGKKLKYPNLPCIKVGSFKPLVRERNASHPKASLTY